jgi:hypothetical protein
MAVIILSFFKSARALLKNFKKPRAKPGAASRRS